MDRTVRRWVGYGGLLFFVLVAIAVFITPNPPNTNATAAKVVTHFHQHQAAYYADAYIIVAAIIVGLTYFWFLREYLGQDLGSRRLQTVAFAGSVVFAMSGAISAGLNFALADASHSGNITGASMQTLNILRNDLNTPMNAAGTATFLILTGLVVLRHGGLPRWLGWVAVVFGVLSVTGFTGPAGVGLWILAASITVLARDRGAVDLRSESQAPISAAESTPEGDNKLAPSS